MASLANRQFRELLNFHSLARDKTFQVFKDLEGLHNTVSRLKWIAETLLEKLKIMNIADTIYQHVQSMPSPLAQEVLDFIQFLEAKSKPATTANTVTVSAQEWNSLQETLFVLQNTELMRQIAASEQSYRQHTGYVPSAEELNALD
jgi:hypothetical protein